MSRRTGMARESSGQTQTIHHHAGRLAYRAVTATRYQLVIVVLVFIITFAFSRNHTHLAALIEVPCDAAIEFFSAVSQALAALLGLLLAFLVLMMQLLEQERSSAFQDFRSETRELINLAIECPAEFAVLQDDLNGIIELLVPLRLGEFPIDRSEWETLVSSLGLKYETLSLASIPWNLKLYLDQIMSILIRIEDIFNKLGTVRIGYILMGRTEFRAFPKLLLLLAISLALLLAFGSIDRLGVFLDLNLPLTFTVLVCVVLTLFELYYEIRYLLRNFEEVWSW